MTKGKVNAIKLFSSLATSDLPMYIDSLYVFRPRYAKQYVRKVFKQQQ